MLIFCLAALEGFDFLLDFPALDDDPVGARFALFCFLAEGASARLSMMMMRRKKKRKKRKKKKRRMPWYRDYFTLRFLEDDDDADPPAPAPSELLPALIRSTKSAKVSSSSSSLLEMTTTRLVPRDMALLLVRKKQSPRA